MSTGSPSLRLCGSTAHRIGISLVVMFVLLDAPMLEVSRSFRLPCRHDLLGSLIDNADFHERLLRFVVAVDVEKPSTWPLDLLDAFPTVRRLRRADLFEYPRRDKDWLAKFLRRLDHINEGKFLRSQTVG